MTDDTSDTELLAIARLIVAESLGQGNWKSADNSAFTIPRDAYLGMCGAFNIDPKAEINS